MKPVRIQLSRKKGFRLSAASLALNGLPVVNCARPGKWGNPFRVGPTQSAEVAVAKFKAYAAEHPEYVAKARVYLRGKNLACFCKVGAACHVDELLALVNKRGGAR